MRLIAPYFETSYVFVDSEHDADCTRRHVDHDRTDRRKRGAAYHRGVNKK